MYNLRQTLILCAAPALLMAAEPLVWPPVLPGGKAVVTDTAPSFLTPGPNLREGVAIAKTAPAVDFLYYPGQDYLGKPWSVWGDGLAVGDKYYSAIGDHKAPDGNAGLYEYDATTKRLRRLVDLRELLKLPDGHYTPGKIHSRIDLGKDGWLYFSTHRGSTRITTEKYHYKGDWIVRHHPQRGVTEVVAHAPLPRQCLPASVLDPERLIYYAGTADGDVQNKRVQFLAYDIQNKRVLYSDDHGFARCAIFARSTGRLYFHATGKEGATDEGPAKLVRFDPAKPGPPVLIEAALGLRAATEELPDGRVYTIEQDAMWEFNTKTEKAQMLGPAIVGSLTYTASLHADAKTGRYLYYVPGAHGGAERDGTPLVQYDVKTRTRKVIAFLRAHYEKQYGYIPQGTYGTAVSPDGATVYITWNGNRGAVPNARKIDFNTCALMAVHIPAAERKP